MGQTSKKNWTPTEPAFRKFLLWLDEGEDSKGERYLDMRKRLPHRTRGTVSVIGNPVRLSATPPLMDSAAPDLGAHNDIYLRETK